MIIKDLSTSFNPCPKHCDKSVKRNHKNEHNNYKKETKNEQEEPATEFCIMPKNSKYSTKRTKKYNERHEVFFSRAYRYKSIEDGLIVFLTEDDHRGTNGVHGKNGNKLNRYLKKLGQKAWMDYYKKTKEEFINRYGQNYL